MQSVHQEEKNKKLKSSLTQMESEDIEKVIEIVNTIKSNTNAINFLFPVDTKVYPDYLKAINDKPMDISTIEAKMSGRKYHFIQDVFDDFQLIWDNCRIYNKEGFDIYYQAERMEEATVLAFEKYYVIQKGEKKNYVREFDNNIYDEEAFNDPNYYNENYMTVDPYYQYLKEKLDASKMIKSFSSNQLRLLIETIPEQLKPYIINEKDNELKLLIEQMTNEDLKELLKVIVDIQNTFDKPIASEPNAIPVTTTNLNSNNKINNNECTNVNSSHSN